MALAFLLALAAQVPVTAPPAPVRPSFSAVVVAAIEDMYSAPSAQTDVVSQALLGQVVEVVAEQGTFARVRTPDGYEGWLSAGSLRAYPEPKEPRYGSRGTPALVTSLVAYVYREPRVTTARPLVGAPFATRLERTGPAVEGWQAVRLPSGEDGFVQDGDVRLLAADHREPSGSGSALVATARRFLGVAYLWGGMSASGLDCSGLVSRVYAFHGTMLPRDADLQFAHGGARAVERDALAPGDLLFFGKESITHVAIYAGEGRMVHATTQGRPMVQESALDEPPWRDLYRGARRPQ